MAAQQRDPRQRAAPPFPARPGRTGPRGTGAQLGQISAATAGRVLRVAWTLADLAAKPRPGPGETSEALALWLGVTP